MHMPDDLVEMAYEVYDTTEIDVKPCPFTPAEIAELEEIDEMLFYVPNEISEGRMIDLGKFECGFNWEVEQRMIASPLTEESYWLACSTSPIPEMLGQSSQRIARVYEDEGLDGMGLRRYMAFLLTYRHLIGELPDFRHWTLLVAGHYDRSGISLVGFDRFGHFGHHGWMKNFKAKMSGGRYVAFPPRKRITPETEQLKRPYRGTKCKAGNEAEMD